MEKEAFLDLLKNILEQAVINDNVISVSEIKENLEDMALDEKQLASVKEYLAVNGVKVVGDEKKKDTKESIKDVSDKQEKEEKIADTPFLKMYLKEIKELEKMSKDEEIAVLSELLSAAESDFNAAKEAYIKRKLDYVVKRARKLSYGGELLEELVEEGNIGLLMAFEELKETAELMKEHIENSIEEAMKSYVDAIYLSDSEEKAMVAKVNFVSEAAKELKKENGAEPTPKEVAAYTNLDEEEVMSIISLSADNLKAD